MSNLPQLARDFLRRNNTAFVYIAIGSHQPTGIKGNENQQIPEWLVRFKCDYPETPVLIILIDPVFRKSEPLLHEGVYGGSWVRNGNIDDIGPKWRSEHGLEMITVAKNVIFEFDRDEGVNGINIISVLQEVVPYCRHGKILTIASFTGYDLSMIKGLINYDEKFMCIDPSNGLDLGCFPNFDRPGTSPVFKTDEHGIRFKVIDDISMLERRRIMHAFELSYDDHSFRLWIEKKSNFLHRLCFNELLFLLRMVDRLEKGIDVEETNVYIRSSIERCLRYDIDIQVKNMIRSIKNKNNIYEILRLVLRCISRQYAKDDHEFEDEINYIISIFESETNKFKLAQHFNMFYSRNFPRI
jgi:hypothetical protein